MDARGVSKLYESDLDRARERHFRDKIEKVFKCQTHKLHINWQVDCILSRHGNGVALAELKCRNIRSDSFPTLIMSVQKLQKGLRLCGHMGNLEKNNESLPLMVFVRYMDCDKWARIISLDGFRRERLMAKNHSDPLDTEWVAHIPNEWFKVF